MKIPIGDNRFEKYQAEQKTDAPRKVKEAVSLKDWEEKVLSAPGAAVRVDEIEEELRLAAGLSARPKKRYREDR